MDELISIPETARRIGVSDTVIRRLIKRGDLKPAKVEMIGRQTRRYLKADDVESLRRVRSGEVQL